MKNKVKKFMVPTDFSDQILNDYAQFNEMYKLKGSVISEIFGSHNNKLIASGRPSNMLPPISKKTLKHHIEYAHSLHIQFDYVLNALCLGDKELKPDYLTKLRKLLDTLAEMEVDIITVANPFLIEFIAQNYNFIVSTSLYLFVEMPQEVQDLYNMGATRITIMQDINRDFKALELITKNNKVEFIIIINPFCKLKCMWSVYHGAQDSQMIDPDLPMTLPFVYLQKICTEQRFSKLEELLKSPWIRPEDLDEYSKFGITIFKIQGRPLVNISKDLLIKRIKAYLSGSYIGDLIDFIFVPFKKINYSLDNKSLDGFIDYLRINKPKCFTECDQCNYCSITAEKQISSL